MLRAVQAASLITTLLLSSHAFVPRAIQRMKETPIVASTRNPYVALPTAIESTKSALDQPSWRGRLIVPPLLRDWDGDTGTRRRFFSSSRGTVDDYSFPADDDDSDDEDEDDLLSYIPVSDEDWDIPPLTRRLLYRATLQYVQGNETRSFPVLLNEVLSVIEQEHDTFDVPVKVGNVTYDVSLSDNELDQGIAEVLSFAALYGVPKEVVNILLGPRRRGETNAVATCQAVFTTQGWKSVSFPSGLGIQVKRNVAKQYGERFAKPRWPWQHRKQAKIAEHMVEDASYAQPPKQRLTSEKEFLKLLSLELTETALPAAVTNENRLAGLKFFPNNHHGNGVLQRVQRSIQRQAELMKAAEMLKTAGRAGTLSYGFLNFAFYAIGVLFQWRRLQIGHSGVSSISSLGKLGRAFGTVYLASQVTKLPRMLLALAMAPFGDRVLHLTRNKLRVSENTAFVILTGTLLGIFFALMTAIVLGDMASRKLLVAAVVYNHLKSKC